MITTKHTMKEAHFPGDPRFSGWISPSSDDTSALTTNDWLSTLLLDCILQRSVPPQEVISMNASHIGSLGVHAYMKACNDLIRNDRAQQVVEDALTKGRKIASHSKHRSHSGTNERLFSCSKYYHQQAPYPDCVGKPFFCALLGLLLFHPRVCCKGNTTRFPEMPHTSC